MKRSLSIGPTTALLAATSLLAIAAPATAQEAAAAEAAATDATEIVVTATRRLERLENVPATVVAISAATLESSGVKTIYDLGLVTPGVQIARAAIYAHPSVRGISTNSVGIGSESNVATYIDGFYQPDPIALAQDFSAVQDIQVLKGPQGTLYGRNASGGAILITTRGPTDTLTGEGHVKYAPRFRDRSASLFVAGPITENVKFSISGYYRKSRGQWVDINRFAPDAPVDTTTYTFGGLTSFNASQKFKRGAKYTAPYKAWQIRPKLLLELSPDLRVTLGYVRNYNSDAGPLAFPNEPTGNGNGNPLNPAAVYNGYPVATQRDTTSQNFQPRAYVKFSEYNGKAEWTLGDFGRLTSRTSYTDKTDFSDFDLDATPVNPTVTNVPAGVGYSNSVGNFRRTFIQQIDYDGSFGAFRLLAGVLYFRDNSGADFQFENTGSAISPTYTTVKYGTRSWAAYMEGAYNIDDRLFITVGGRYSSDKKKFVRVQVDKNGVFVPSASSACYTDGVFTPACTTPSQRFKKGQFTPSANIRYNLSGRTNIYASFARGFKAPVINVTNPFNKVRPEKATGYEVGIKTAGGGFRAELSAFYSTYKDNQVNAFNSNTLSTVQLLTNSGGARIYGLDASLSYQPPETALNLRAGFSYLHARYRNYPGSNTIIGPTGTNTTVTGNFSGRRMVRAPDFSGNVGVDYTLPLAGGELETSGTLTFSSRYAPNDISYQCPRVSRTPAGADIPFVAGTQGFCAAGAPNKGRGRFEQPGYITINGQIAWTDPGDHYTITVYGTNLTDKRIKLISRAFAFGTDYIYNRPREIGVKLAAKF